MNRKGVELTLNFVIIATISLILLVLVTMLLTGTFGPWKQDVQSCDRAGGTCAASCSAGMTSSTFYTSNCEKGEVCCIPQELA
jgi:hypothetical protein